MPNARTMFTHAAPALLLALLGAEASPARAQQQDTTTGETPTVNATNTALDAGLFTTYEIDQEDQNLSFVVCGSTTQSEGCYGSGSIGPLNRIGTAQEGYPYTIKNTVTRDIYLLDVEAGNSNDEVKLYIYRKTDAITSSYDQVSVALYKIVPLPQLTGGKQALSFMAGNREVLAIGTDQSQYAVLLNKCDDTLTQIGGFSPPLNVTSITADSSGYITVTQGNGVSSGFTVIGPHGLFEEDGGGAPFMLNDTNGTNLSTLLQSGQINR